MAAVGARLGAEGAARRWRVQARARARAREVVYPPFGLERVAARSATLAGGRGRATRTLAARAETAARARPTASRPPRSGRAGAGRVPGGSRVDWPSGSGRGGVVGSGGSCYVAEITWQTSIIHRPLDFTSA